ncbi:MAG: phosphatidylserine decarboxylase [Vicingaceae bacterium]|nr:MAG: phosphatidylserine decarboxylase [Vicingaceae bacterium]
MTIHKEGIVTIVIVFIFCVILSASVFYFTDNSIIRNLTIILCLVLLLLVLQFFRNPRRHLVINDNFIVSPADGKIVVIEETVENEYLKEKRKQVSVFMSPFNVHINRYPISGKIEYFKYHPGLYLVAWHPKSSTDNERTTIVVHHPEKGKILFRQIAGALARRIKFYGKVGQEVKQSDECGFIKFGSRVDIFLPIDAKICVKLGQNVIGGQTIIAEW